MMIDEFSFISEDSEAQTAVDGVLGGKWERGMRDGRSGRCGAGLASKARSMASVECIYMCKLIGNKVVFP